MLQSNLLMFESANISLQFADDKSSDKSQANYKINLDFRESSNFNGLRMIPAKIYEVELINMRKIFKL